MSFLPFSFNPTSVKNDSMKYFEKRQTEMYILRYRCPNDDVFDPTTHLTNFKSVFLMPNREALLNIDSMKEDLTENVLAEDLLSLGITAPPEQCIENMPKSKQKDNHIYKQSQSFFNEQERNSNTILHHKTHTLLDELTQSDIYYVNNSNDILKLIFRLIKEKKHEKAFENINKSINIYSQYEVANYLTKKRNLSGLILYIAFVGLLLSISTNDILKQFQYLNIISDYPMNQSDLPHFYHLYDEIILTNIGIKQLTLAHLLGFPLPFFIPTDIDPNARNRNFFRRYKNRSRSGIRKNDAIFNHIMNKKFRLNPNERDYDNDDFNDDYSDNDYDYYDFDSDNEVDFYGSTFGSCDDFDYGNLHHHNQQSIDDMPPDIKREFFNKTFRSHERKKFQNLSKKSFELNKTNSNNNDKDKKGTNTNNCNNDNDTSQWKTALNNENDINDPRNMSPFKKGSSSETKSNPLFNVVFNEDPNIPRLPRINQYYAYRASNSSRIVNCNFIPSPEFSRYIGFNDNEYNYSCLPHFIQPYMTYKSLNDDRITEQRLLNPNGTDNLVSKYIKMTESKDYVKSLCSFSKIPMPKLTCAASPDEIDDDLADEIKAAVAIPDFFTIPKLKPRSKASSKSSQDNFEDISDNMKPNTNHKNAKSSKIESTSSFHSPFGSDDDDDFNDDENYSILNNMFKKDILNPQPGAIQFLSRMISNSDSSIGSKKSYVVQSPGTKTTTEIKKIGNGTTITKITTTTSNIKLNGNLFSDDDIIPVSNPPPRPSKDKRKKRRDGK